MTGTSREAQIVDAMLKAGIEEGRREAFREAEAWIRDRGSWRTRDLADEFRFRFLSPDNPEGNA